MPLILLFLILIPLIEITVLIEVGARIGAGPTLLGIVGTAVVGLYLVRRQGLKVAMRMRDSLVRNEPPVAALIEGFFLLVAGVCLLIPGFVTDLFGAVLLIPPFRIFLGRAGLARLFLGYPQPGMHRDQEGHIVVEGQYAIREENIIEGDQEDPEKSPDPDR